MAFVATAYEAIRPVERARRRGHVAGVSRDGSRDHDELGHLFKFDDRNRNRR